MIACRAAALQHCMLGRDVVHAPKLQDSKNCRLVEVDERCQIVLVCCRRRSCIRIVRDQRRVAHAHVTCSHKLRHRLRVVFALHRGSGAIASAGTGSTSAGFAGAVVVVAFHRLRHKGHAHLAVATNVVSRSSRRWMGKLHKRCRPCRRPGWGPGLLTQNQAPSHRQVPSPTRLRLPPWQPQRERRAAS